MSIPHPDISFFRLESHGYFNVQNFCKILPLQHHRIHLQTAPCTQPSLQPGIWGKTITDLKTAPTDLLLCCKDSNHLCGAVFLLMILRSTLECKMCVWSTLERTASSISGGRILQVIHEPRPLNREIEYNWVGWRTRFLHCERDSNSSNLLRDFSWKTALGESERLLVGGSCTTWRTVCFDLHQRLLEAATYCCRVLFGNICCKCLMKVFPVSCLVATSFTSPLPRERLSPAKASRPWRSKDLGSTKPTFKSFQ